jgi:hypothetical protein
MQLIYLKTAPLVLPLQYAHFAKVVTESNVLFQILSRKLTSSIVLKSDSVESFKLITGASLTLSYALLSKLAFVSEMNNYKKLTVKQPIIRIQKSIRINGD